jgi:hypothetical protein
MMPKHVGANNLWNKTLNKINAFVGLSWTVILFICIRAISLSCFESFTEWRFVCNRSKAIKKLFNSPTYIAFIAGYWRHQWFSHCWKWHFIAQLSIIQISVKRNLTVGCYWLTRLWTSTTTSHYMLFNYQMSVQMWAPGYLGVLEAVSPSSAEYRYMYLSTVLRWLPVFVSFDLTFAVHSINSQ